jgi:hypothetical protein
MTNNVKPPATVYIVVDPDGTTLRVARTLDELPKWAVHQWVGTYQREDVNFLALSPTLL